jgi:hypothetical protein
MNKAQAVRAIVRLYFVGAIAGSFTHIIEASGKLGLHSWEQWSTPFMIDGLVLIGTVMRSAEFSVATRGLGLRVQVAMGLVSLAANVYAACPNPGGMVFGAMIVAGYLGGEWLVGRVESAQVDVDRIKAELAEQAKAERSERARKGAVTRKRNATTTKRRRTVQAKALEEMLNV